MSIRDQMLDDLAKVPEDWKLRGMIADWCEDNDRPDEAAALRWMVKHQKRPYHGTTSRSATWFNAETIGPGLGDPESDLPEPVFAQLEGGKPVANHMTYPGLREAEEAFLAAYVKARKQGWKGGE